MRPKLYLVETSRTYDPETVAVVTAAFDAACQSISARMNHDEDVRRRLAEALRRVDRGKRDPTVIATAAMDQLTVVDAR